MRISLVQTVIYRIRQLNDLLRLLVLLLKRLRESKWLIFVFLIGIHVVFFAFPHLRFVLLLVTIIERRALGSLSGGVVTTILTFVAFSRLFQFVALKYVRQRLVISGVCHIQLFG